MTPPPDYELLRRLEDDVEAVRSRLRNAPAVPIPGVPDRVAPGPHAAGADQETPELARLLAEANTRLDAVRRRLREHDLAPEREAR